MGRTISIVAIVIVLMAATGMGAYALGDRAGFQHANQVRQQFFQQRQGAGGQGQQGGGFGTGGGAAGAGGGGGGQARGIPGSIKSINGDTLVITVGQRDLNININNQTQIERATSGSRTELAPGESVLVTPNTIAGGSGGTLDATTILILPTQ